MVVDSTGLSDGATVQVIRAQHWWDIFARFNAVDWLIFTLALLGLFAVSFMLVKQWRRKTRPEYQTPQPLPLSQ